MYNPPAIKKAIEILRLVVRANEPLGVSEVARRLGIVKSTALGILKSLEEEGLVVQEGRTKKYLPGSGLYEFSREALRSMQLHTVARPFLERLVELVDETVSLGVREDDNTIHVLEVIEPKKEMKITSPVGTRFPLFAGALMKVFFSRMSDDEIVRFLRDNPLPRYTEHTITRVEDLLQEIRKVREQGYAVDLEEYRKGVRAIAALVFRGSTPRAAISIFGLASSMEDARLPGMIFHLKNTAQLISARLTSMARGTDEGVGPELRSLSRSSDLPSGT